MKTTTIGASEFKAKCLRLLDEVAQKGETIVVTKRGRPIAKVQPVALAPKSLRDTWKGLVKIKGDIVYFDTSEEWESNS